MRYFVKTECSDPTDTDYWRSIQELTDGRFVVVSYDDRESDVADLTTGEWYCPPMLKTHILTWEDSKAVIPGYKSTSVNLSRGFAPENGFALEVTYGINQDGKEVRRVTLVGGKGVEVRTSTDRPPDDRLNVSEFEEAWKAQNAKIVATA